MPACNGDEGFEIAQRGKPDPVLMDLQMPVFDIIETISFLKADSNSWGHSRLLAAAAPGVAEDKERCFQAGADGYVAKPNEIDMMRNEADEIITRPLPAFFFWPLMI